MDTERFQNVLKALTISLLLGAQLVALPAALADQKKSTMLHSNVQTSENMQNSVKVIVAPPSAPKPKAFNLGANNHQLSGNSNVRQLSGSQAYSPGTEAPPIPKPPRPFHNLGAQSSGAPIGALIAPVPASRGQIPLLPKPIPSHTPPNGISSWVQGYGTSIVPQRPVVHATPFQTRTGAGLSSLGANASLSQPRVNALLAQPRTGASLSNTNTSATLANQGLHGKAISLPPAQLKAKQMELPTKHLARPANWSEWYERIAKAVYNQWQQNGVGAGKSLLFVTVYNSRDVDCKVISFTEAPGATRDGTRESIFREASLKAVSSLNGDELWEFPVTKNPPKKVTFDMEFSHGVGETSGCRVVRVH